MSARGSERGALAVVLHTHMPYVEGFDTWPFGEEWLWGAMIDCYLPLLELLATGAPLTLSLTPVLCDQLQAGGVAERFERFIDSTRRAIHEEDVRGLREGGEEALASELERAWAEDCEGALRRFAACRRDLCGALAPFAQWTSSATHAVLALLASDRGVDLQVRAGIESHRARFEQHARWRGGFWLPECAHASWLEPLLARAGVRSTCVELTGRFGLGAPEHLRPVWGAEGLVLVPIDRATMSLVWSDGGYPAAGAYRDYHHHTIHHHRPWANDGTPYDRERACAQARAHAADFVARTIERLRSQAHGAPGGGLVVCALDTELLGHWWYEGIVWLSAVVAECARQGLALQRLDDALAAREPQSIELREPDAASTWGEGRDLSTWSAPVVADMAFAARACELDVVAAGPAAGEVALRELLALQASDWTFLVSRDLAVAYARERFDGHRRRLRRALAGDGQAGAADLRNIAIHAAGQASPAQ